MQRQGQALIIVVVFLAMFFVIGVAFFLLSQTEQLASIKHLDAIRSRYIAEAGIAYAKQILTLDKDANAIDSLHDITFLHFEGAGHAWEIENQPDTKWFTILDSDGTSFGRFTVGVADEAGKLNANACTLQELQRLFTLRGVDSSLAALVIAGRPFDAIEEIGQAMGKDEFEKVRYHLTVYSRDWEFDLNKKRRVYLNAANPQLVLDVFLKRGVADARKKAAMLIDASDTDTSATVFSEAALNYVTPTGMMDEGGWVNKGNFYEAQPKAAGGVFLWTNLALADGDYDCFLYGPGEEDIVGRINQQTIHSGDKLSSKVSVVNGGFTLVIEPASDTISRFSHVELINEELLQGMRHAVIRGAEALAINEVMVNPIREYSVNLSAAPGDTVKKTMTLADLLPGTYHVIVVSPGYAGDVTVNGKTGRALMDGEYLPQSIEIGTGLSLTVTLNNNDSVKPASLTALKLSQQPDGEYLELVNLSPYDIDISDYTLEVFNPDGELVTGWPARIPEDTVIKPFQYIVLNVDSNDGSLAPPKLKGNKVSFKHVWGFSGINLYFEDYHNVIDKSFDLLPDQAGNIMLKDRSGRVVDAVEYSQLQLNAFVSIERGDPSARIDGDTDGFIDGWYASNTNAQGTPGLTNENFGMYTEAEGVLTKHLVTELRVFNRPLIDLLEVSQIPSGDEWKLFNLNDIARLADSFAYGAESFAFAGAGSAVDFITLPARGGSGSWDFHGIPFGVYWLGIEGINASGASIRIAAASTTGDSPAYAARSFEGNNLPYGTIEITGISDEGGNLYISIINDSDSLLKLKRVVLEPVVNTTGRINVNTAKGEVLRSVLPSDSLADKLEQSRPIGNANGAQFGIGDLLLLHTDFLACHKALTVKSDTYELQSRGEYLKLGKPSTSDVIRIIFERGD